MTSEAEVGSSPSRTKLLVWGLSALGVILLGGFLYVILVGNVKPPASVKGDVEDSTLEVIRDALLKQTDDATCRDVLQKYNSYVNKAPANRPPSLDEEHRKRLEQTLHLNQDELSEIDSSTYTGLDAHHLDLCFLLRDAARTIQADVVSAVATEQILHLTPLEQATAAFSWTMRQVRLEDGQGPPVPPQYVLRRGSGDALERALVFLDLLRQFRADADPGMTMTGCLLLVPSGGSGEPRLWSVGVVIDEKMYLFDPRMGLPIPGPQGKGVATLAEVVNDPGVLRQLTVNEKYPYDVTANEAKKCEAFLYVSLSGLAPRMSYFQKNALADVIHVNLTADVFGEETVVHTALEKAGAASTSARVSADGLRMLRSFLPVEDGGAAQVYAFRLAELPGFTDPRDTSAVQMWRKRYYEMRLIPWQAQPPFFQTLPFNVGLGSFMREKFAQPFRKSALEPLGARDLILRGRYRQAMGDLTNEYDQHEGVLGAYNRAIATKESKELFFKDVEEWAKNQAIPAYANLERAKQSGNPAEMAAATEAANKIWENAGNVILFLKAAIAMPRQAEVTYQLALCKQELAEQIQLSLDTARRENAVAPKKTDVERAKNAWKSADEWWRHAAQEFNKGRISVAIRRPRGRCQAMFGEWGAAISTWEDVSGDMPPMERVGNLYLAQQLKKLH